MLLTKKQSWKESNNDQLDAKVHLSDLIVNKYGNIQLFLQAAAQYAGEYLILTVLFKAQL